MSPFFSKGMEVGVLFILKKIGVGIFFPEKVGGW